MVFQVFTLKYLIERRCVAAMVGLSLDLDFVWINCLAHITVPLRFFNYAWRIFVDVLEIVVATTICYLKDNMTWSI
jgi:hypothetical protein